MKMYQDVTLFNTMIIGIDHPDGKFKPLDEEQCHWFQKVVCEELDEYLAAYTQQDPNEQIDAVLDLVYFALGTLVKMGMTNQQIRHAWQQIQDANMKKVLGDKGRGSAQDAIKPEGWKKPEGVL
jgi:predicted HAD superfamily Cof-like phosphohydrolase